MLIDRIEEAGKARYWREKPGGRELRDCVANGSFSGLIRRAEILVRPTENYNS